MRKKESDEKDVTKVVEKEAPKKAAKVLDETNEKNTPKPDAATENMVDTQIELGISNEFKLPGAGEPHPLSHKSLKKVIIAALIVVGLAIIGGLVLWSTHEEPVSNGEEAIVFTQGAAVTAVEGSVEYNTGSGWNTVESGTNLQEGYSLRTLKASRAIITLDEGSAVRLDSDSVVTLTKLTAEEVVINNQAGQVYTRVVPSETRIFVVTVDEDNYEALGTAYMTVNKTEEKGVEVYHSKVKTLDPEKAEKQIAEGEAYFKKSADKARELKIAKLDLEKLKDDAFLKWNKGKDAAKTEFADKLGFIKDIDKPKEEPKPEPAATPAAIPAPTPDGISAWGTKADNGIKVSWSVKNVATNSGFKIAYSTDDTTPSYPGNSYKYVGDSNATSAVLSLTDGKTYHVRVCAYRPESEVKCATYSNTVSVTAPDVAYEEVNSGTVALDPIASDGTTSWSITGTSPYGYKVVYSKTESPVYPGSDYIYVSSENTKTTKLPTEKFTSGDKYHVRVCKYNKHGETKCIVYSNIQPFNAP